MHSEAIRDELLKVDALGRVRVSPERRDALLDAFESCGVSAMEFAAHVGVKYQTFATWRQKRNRQQQSGGASVVSLPISRALPGTGMQWLEAVLENPVAEARSESMAPDMDLGAPVPVLNVMLPGGARVEIADGGQAQLAAELIRALAGKGCAAC
jgi:hypothetical protein